MSKVSYLMPENESSIYIEGSKCYVSIVYIYLYNIESIFQPSQW